MRSLALWAALLLPGVVTPARQARRTVLDAYFDALDWETMPIGVSEIDHVEVVEGTASYTGTLSDRF